MPLFDFKCTKCEHVRLDKLLKASDLDAEVICTECEAPMKKQLGLSRFKMGKSCFVKVNPSRAEQISSEAMMQDYKDRIKGDVS